MKYGGIERVVLSLIRKQRQTENEIEVIAPSDSKVQGLIQTVKSIGVDDIYQASTPKDKVRANSWTKMAHAAMVLDNARGRQDTVFHAHDDYLLPFFSSIGSNIIMTLHSPYEEFWMTEDFPDITDHTGSLIAISHKQRQIYESHGYKIMAVVYNGIDVEEHQHSLQKDDFLLSLSAVAPHKGQHTAIELAKQKGLPLIIAGNIANNDYYNEKIRQHMTHDLTAEQDKLAAYRQLPQGPKIVYVGPVNDEQKKPLYAQARAFLMPVYWEEPFGLVAVEALAGATPVIAMERGALPELINPGITGFLCKDEQGMADAIDKIDTLDKQACRQDAEARFSSQKMAEDYIRIYEQLLHESRATRAFFSPKSRAVAAYAPGRAYAAMRASRNTPRYKTYISPRHRRRAG
jgi:glycosyltransferase involved in cell wall biosynthesis